MSDWDVVIVGAGPAGMSAALILARCRRRVLLTDSGTPRSWAAHHTHGFLSRDGMDLQEFQRTGLKQLSAYPNVVFRPVEVRAIDANHEGFTVQLADDSQERCRKVLLASGVFDQLPEVPGIERYYGKTAHPCPYCDGWERQDLPLAIYGKASRGFEMARAMTAWSSDLILCTNGPARLSAAQRSALAAHDIEIIAEPIVELLGEHGELECLRFANGELRHRRALFFDTPCPCQSGLAQGLGCRMTRGGKIVCGRYEESSVPGVFAAGNILRDVQLSIVAAADGARAAFGINLALTREDFAERTSPRHAARAKRAGTDPVSRVPQAARQVPSAR